MGCITGWACGRTLLWRGNLSGSRRLTGRLPSWCPLCPGGYLCFLPEAKADSSGGVGLSAFGACHKSFGAEPGLGVDDLFGRAFHEITGRVGEGAGGAAVHRQSDAAYRADHHGDRIGRIPDPQRQFSIQRHVAECRARCSAQPAQADDDRTDLQGKGSPRRPRARTCSGPLCRSVSERRSEVRLISTPPPPQKAKSNRCPPAAPGKPAPGDRRAEGDAVRQHGGG